HFRSARSEARRRQSRSGCADDPSCKAGSIPPGTASSVDMRRAGRLPSASRAIRWQPRQRPRLHFHPRYALGHRPRSSSLLCAIATDWPTCGRGEKRARAHYFRHPFPVLTLTRWYESGEDAARRLPVLSTYLGHVYVEGTYWYLSGWPELMAQAMARLERRWGEP